MEQLEDPMIEFSVTKSKTKKSTISTLKSDKPTQRLRFANGQNNKFYSFSDHPYSSLHAAAPYRRESNCVIQLIDWIRWKLNLILLFKPFACLHCVDVPCCGRILGLFKASFIYRLTLLELAFYVFFFYPIMYWQYFARWWFNDLDNANGGKGSGSMAMYWYTATFMLAMRNNVVFQFLFGFSFERTLYFHRIAGMMAIIIAIVHFVYCAEYKDYDNFGIYMLSGPQLPGTIALFASFLLVVLSLEVVRRRLFEVFYKSHYVLFITMLVTLYIHDGSYSRPDESLIHRNFIDDTISWAAVVFVVDLLFRGVVMVLNPVTVTNMRLLNGNVIKLEFDKKRFRYSSGQYVFICIPAIGLTEFHPYSISTSPSCHVKNVQIHIRVLGDWTKRLQKLVQRYEEINFDWTKLLCFVEGPYGELQISQRLHNYSSICMISGGIGITPLQSIFNELIVNIRMNKNKFGKLRRLHFVWTVREPTLINEFGRRHWSGVKFANAKYHEDDNQDDEEASKYIAANSVGSVEDSRYAPSRKISVSLPHFFSPNLFMVTKVGQTIVESTEVLTHFYLTGELSEQLKQHYAQKFPFLKFGRPNIAQIIDDARMKNLDCCSAVKCGCIAKGCGLAVFSCGPRSMVLDAEKYGTKYGADVHTEIFDF